MPSWYMTRVMKPGLTLLRHVGRNDTLSGRPSRTWNRRSPARVADASTGLLVAVLAQEADRPAAEFLRYAGRHSERALMPVAVMGLGGLRGSGEKSLFQRVIKALRLTRELSDYLWHGRAAADAHGTRTAFVRAHFTAMLDADALDVPAGLLDPFIDYVTDKLARAAFESSPAAPEPDGPAGS